MAKYKDLKELSEAFKAGELEGWMLMVDNDCTHLQYHGPLPEGMKTDTDESEAFEDKKYDEGKELYNGQGDVYILDQALTLCGIPNEGV